MAEVGWREKQRRIREEAILDSATDLLMQNGYDSMSMDEVAARIGISKATLYSHFASKEELVIEVIIAAIRSIEATIEDLDPRLRAIERLDILIRSCIAQRVELAALKFNVFPHRLEQHDRFREQRKKLATSVKRLIDEARKEGTIAAFLPADLVTDFIFTLIAYGVEMGKAENPMEPGEIGSLFTSILFRGICVQPMGGQPLVSPSTARMGA